MARIPDGSFKNWQETDVVHATDYVQEREMLRAAANDNSDRLSDLELVTTGLQLDTVQLSKITNDVGAPKISLYNTSDDILANLLTLGRGMHTFYAGTGVKNLPPSNISIRGIAHFTNENIGWVYATDYKNNIFTNYYDTNKWSGWERLAKQSELPVNTDTNWATLALGKDLTKYATGTELRWRRVNGIVYLTGAFTGDLDWNDIIATLPVGARPDYTHHFIMPTSIYTRSEGRNARYQIGTDGRIMFSTTNDGTLTTSDWFPINTSFPV